MTIAQHITLIVMAKRLPFVIAMERDPRLRSPSISMASPAISSPRSTKKAMPANTQIIPFQKVPVEMPPNKKVLATERHTIRLPGSPDCLKRQLYNTPITHNNIARPNTATPK
jgi:hypothetical protein